MYLREVHVETDIPTLQEVIRQHPLGLLITSIPSSQFPFIQTSHIPFILDVPPADEGEDGEDGNKQPLGTLRGHMARANPQVKAMIEHLTNHPSGTTDRANVLPSEVLVMFTLPHDAYVTPKFYTHTKPSTGKVAPTWNYAAVAAYGTITVFFDRFSDDEKENPTKEFLYNQIEALTDIQEHARNPDAPWTVSDAPSRYISLLSKAIVGIEITITRLEGKFKMSQELHVEDREGVVAGFTNLEKETGSEGYGIIADMVKKRGEKREEKKVYRDRPRRWVVICPWLCQLSAILLILLGPLITWHLYLSMSSLDML